MRAPRKLKQLLLLAVFAAGLALFNYVNNIASLESDVAGLGAPQVGAEGVGGADLLIAEAFHQRRSDQWLAGAGRITRVLADDNNGSRHQRFLLELESGHSLLVAHNIDLAPRIDKLREGQSIEFYGEYEWNEKGGVIHWTHRDPKGKRPGGWLKYEGRVYR